MSVPVLVLGDVGRNKTKISAQGASIPVEDTGNKQVEYVKQTAYAPVISA